MDPDQARDANGLTGVTRSPSPTPSDGSLDIEALCASLDAQNADAQPAGGFPAQPAGGLRAQTTASSSAQTAAGTQAHSATPQRDQRLARQSPTYRDWDRRRRTGKHTTRRGRGTKRLADQRLHHPVAKRALALYDDQFGAQSYNPFFGGAPGSAFAPLAGTSTPTTATPASTPTSAATSVTLDARQFQRHQRQVASLKKTQDRNRYLDKRHRLLTKQIEEVRKENKDLARELDSVHKDHRADVEVLEEEIKNLEGLIDKDQEELEQQAHQIVVLTHQLHEELLRRGIFGATPPAAPIPAFPNVSAGPGAPDPFPLI